MKIGYSEVVESADLEKRLNGLEKLDSCRVKEVIPERLEFTFGNSELIVAKYKIIYTKEDEF